MISKANSLTNKNENVSQGGDEIHEALGALVLPDGQGVYFRVWAPSQDALDVVLEPDGRSVPLSKDAGGFFSGTVSNARAGQRYRYRLTDGELVPDPASRFQPEGVDGPSEIIDTKSFRWTDSEWPGTGPAGQVLYEMHAGTFTKEGTYEAAAKLLPHLKELGITVIELMPVADFSGKFGWGYDGVLPYASYEPYGRPEELASFIDAAHSVGIGVILDVVYNHIGPIGNVLPQFAKDYFSETKKTDWGACINFDGENSSPVREYFRENACYWIRDLHFDGLRLDATQDIHDDSEKHIIAEIVEHARQAAKTRKIIIIAENEPQQSYLVRRTSEGGYGLDGLWNDDFHHSAIVALTGQSDAYYTDYRGRPQEFISAMKYGYLYQGQWYQWQKKNRGVPDLEIGKCAFVNFIQNHDQIANSATGARIHELTSPGKLRALTAVLLLGPATPMLFQGQEFASPTPFFYFADHADKKLAESVRQGRRDFLKQWQNMKDPALDSYLVDPSDPQTFERCKLDFRECDKQRAWYDLHSDLLRLRREDEVFSTQARFGLDGSVLGREAFVMRFFSETRQHDRLLLVNLGVEEVLSPLPDPLLAPPFHANWKLLWSSEHPRYRGNGVAPVITENGWRLPGYAAVVLAAEPSELQDAAKMGLANDDKRS
jgi:maltooligosyltrehalose trehalohydrolase